MLQDSPAIAAWWEWGRGGRALGVRLAPVAVPAAFCLWSLVLPLRAMTGSRYWRMLFRVGELPFALYTGGIWLLLLAVSVVCSLLGLGVDFPIDQEQLLSPTYILMATLWGPIVETVLFQLLPLELLRRFRVIAVVRILASAMLFGGMHYYSLRYVAIATVLGLILAASFDLRRRCRTVWSAFGAVCLAHILNNATSYLAYYLFGY